MPTVDAFNAANTSNYPSLLNQLMARNLIVNGGFTINQRAYASGGVLASGSYGHDRWKAGASGGDYSFSQLASNTTITIASGKTLIQVIEDKMVLSTGNYVLSWTGTAQARYAANSATPAGSYAASPIVITGQTAGTTMSVEFNTGTLGDVMLERAQVVPSNYQPRPYPLEMMLCQRYLPGRTFDLTAVNRPVGYGQCKSTTTALVAIPFQVRARAQPTGIVAVTAGQWAVTGSTGTAIAATAVAFSANASSYECGGLDITVASGLTAGNATHFLSNNTAAAAVLLFTGADL